MARTAVKAALLTFQVIAMPAFGQGTISMTLNAAPQDGAVYLSWNRDVAPTIDVAWRRSGASPWQHLAVRGSFKTVTRLQNGVPYQFRVSATDVRGASHFSPIIEETPRERDDCGFGAALFCTPEDLIAALPNYRMSMEDLRCMDRPIGPTLDAIPNCRFLLPGFALGLNRFAGERFTPPSQLANPVVVRAVLLHATWRTDDARVMRQRAREAATPVAPAYRGRVSPSAEANSYLVRLAPMLYSRITRFRPPQHVTGRYAIFHEGHGESALAGGADIINWLLERGWEVWGIDMPLDGLNGADQLQPLLTHDDIPFVAPDASTGLRWFYMGIAAATSLILDDAPPGSTLMVAGRSGGAWTSYIYAAMDPRVDIVVNISGGSPAMTQMDSSLFHRPSAHYENILPFLTDQVSSTDLLLAGGTRASLTFYNSNDPCCYRFKPDHPWVRYINSLDTRSKGKRYHAFVGDSAIHGLTPAAFQAWDSYLTELGLPPLRKRPSQQRGSGALPEGGVAADRRFR